MKKIISAILSIVAIFSLASCGTNRKSGKNSVAQEIAGYSITNELPSVSLSNSDYNSFCSYLAYDNIDCPYSELFGVDKALAEKNNRNFDVQEHAYDFFNGSSSVDPSKLYDVVKANNKIYMDGVSKYFNKELSNSKLKECCEIVADTLNWGIENIDGIDLDELGCILGNLKILNRGSMNLGTFNNKNDLLNISPNMIKQTKNRNGNSDMYEITISHEAMHILQCRCSDVEQSEKDSFIGTSYFFESLDVNPLKHSWLYEASAELNTTMRFGCNPTTYKYMIDNLESIGLATVLDDTVKPGQLEKLCFTQDDETLYRQLGFKDAAKSVELLYAVELLRNQPDDFKTAYENAHGTLEEDYYEFLKKTYNPYFVEVVSELLYKNLALKLTQNEISLNDIFYIISVYELDLLKDIPLDNSTVREKYATLYEQYITLRETFFSYLQKYTEVNVKNSFNEYQINYENGSTYANASLDWLSTEKRNYILSRNNAMYDKNYKHIGE